MVNACPPCAEGCAPPFREETNFLGAAIIPPSKAALLEVAIVILAMIGHLFQTLDFNAAKNIFACCQSFFEMASIITVLHPLAGVSTRNGWFLPAAV